MAPILAMRGTPAPFDQIRSFSTDMRQNLCFLPEVTFPFNAAFMIPKADSARLFFRIDIQYDFI
jgi:hypothetical protein